MAREWIDSANGEFETPFGSMYYAVTQADHVYIGSKSSHARVVIRGVEYHFSVHLYLVDGHWTMKPAGKSDWDARHNLYMTRANPRDYIKLDASDSARSKALTEVTSAWETFIKARPELLRAGELHRINNALRDIEEKEEKIEKELSDLKAKRAELERQEAGIIQNPERSRIV